MELALKENQGCRAEIDPGINSQYTRKILIKQGLGGYGTTTRYNRY
ncbi:hypothetical protein [Mesorhizobium sp. M7A.T.Ca.TU.009.02.1.1]|nr:hypothetical protein [Mesorhizobium sp. M7A.T.Ca.TU.009.02.1.1]